MFENTSKTLDTTVRIMKMYETQIRDLNCTNFNQTNNEVNDLIYILEIAFNYTNTIINTKPVNFTSIKRLSNLFDKTTVVNTYITNTAYKSLYGLWNNTYYFNYYSSLFNASTISYKTQQLTITNPSTATIISYNNNLLSYSKKCVNLTFYDLFYQFQYLGNSFENVSSKDSQGFIILSNNMRNLSYYFNTLNIKLANFTKNMNNTSYINETENFIIEFITFTESNLFLNTTVAIILKNQTILIRSLISTALYNIYDALYFVYIPTTTSTTSTTVTHTTTTSTTSTTETPTTSTTSTTETTTTTTTKTETPTTSITSTTETTTTETPTTSTRYTTQTKTIT